MALTSFWSAARKACVTSATLIVMGLSPSLKVMATTGSSSSGSATSGSSSSEAIDPIAYKNAIATIEWMMNEFHQASGIPGISFAMGYGGETVLVKGYGFAEVAQKRAVEPSTRFRYSNLSTLVTATAIMQLAEQGQIDLDADITTYVPDFPKKRFPVTVRQLLSHTSGVGHFEMGAQFNDFNRGKRPIPTLKEALRQFAVRPLKFKPGTDYLFSAYGYVLLGLAIENVSKTSFEDYIQKQVLRPNGLAEIHFDSMNARPPEQTLFYNRLEYSVREAAKRDFSFIKPAAGMNGSARDIVQLLSNYWRGTVLPPLSFAAMLTAADLPPEKAATLPFKPAMGWRLSTDYLGDLKFYMEGKTIGATAAYMSDPKNGIHMAYLGNARAESHPRTTLNALMLPIKKILTPTTADPATAFQCPVGKFQTRGKYAEEFSTGTMAITQEDNQCTGSIKTPAKMINEFSQQGSPLPDDLAMIYLATKGDTHLFAIVTPLGILVAPIEITDKGVKATIPLFESRESWQISATKSLEK